jgi:general secretion pathway protein G
MFNKKQAKGFTLIELLVVIAIIGILSSVVLASLNTARLKSRDTRRIADVKQIQNALALYYDSNSVYPEDIYDGSIAPTYMAAVPQDPVGPTPYSYAGISDGTNCSSYHIGATLEEATNQALGGDIDSSGGVACGAGTDFDGADPVYDQRP